MQIHPLPPFVHLCCFVWPYVFCLRIWSQTTESKSIGMSLWKFFCWLQWISFRSWNSFLFLYIKVWCFISHSLKAVALQLWYVQWLQDCALRSLGKESFELTPFCLWDWLLKSGALLLSTSIRLYFTHDAFWRICLVPWRVYITYKLHTLNLLPHVLYVWISCFP